MAFMQILANSLKPIRRIKLLTHLTKQTNKQTHHYYTLLIAIHLLLLCLCFVAIDSENGAQTLRDGTH